MDWQQVDKRCFVSPPYAIYQDTRGGWDAWIELLDDKRVLKREISSARAAKLLCGEHLKQSDSVA